MSSDSDPFERFLRPSETETDEERAARIAAETTAARVSIEIDESLKAERLAAKKRRQKEVKALLLGQEAILDALVLEFQSLPGSSSRDHDGFSISLGSDGNRRDASFVEIKMRLSPVLSIEGQLVQKLNFGAEAEDAASGVVRSWPATKSGELTVRGASWKKSFQKKQYDGLAASGPKSVDGGIDWDDREDPGVIFNACREEMVALWNDPRVRATLQKQKVDLADSGGFFLDELDRITARRYIPSDDDVLRARLKTAGAAEHSFTMTAGPEKGTVWRIYDVGGSRSQRLIWASFFDDVDAVLFLAPVSAFDQVLSEDRTMNRSEKCTKAAEKSQLTSWCKRRLQDSLTLWTELCKNKILAEVPLVLFLNKSDLLKKKIESGEYTPQTDENAVTQP
ncbi:hypothetical protein FRB97_000484 [Tulasnella sp. 331]|nr:hypothetical protein FRB97_000484 [Tulasnella sp. 331]